MDEVKVIAKIKYTLKKYDENQKLFETIEREEEINAEDLAKLLAQRK